MHLCVGHPQPSSFLTFSKTTQSTALAGTERRMHGVQPLKNRLTPASAYSVLTHTHTRSERSEEVSSNRIYRRVMAGLATLRSVRRFCTCAGACPGHQLACSTVVCALPTVSHTTIVCKHTHDTHDTHDTHTTHTTHTPQTPARAP
jgi:hypothetical protein